MSLLVIPTSVKPGETARVEVIAKDPDGDRLNYSFVPTGGTLVAFGASANWTLPDEAGTYTIDVTVTDGRGGESNRSTNVLAVRGGELSGHLFSWDAFDLGGTRIFVFKSIKDLNDANCTYSTMAVATSRSNARFSIALPEGTYWVWAWKDVNANGLWDAGDVASVYRDQGSCSGQWPPSPINVVEDRTTNVFVCLRLNADGAPLPMPRCP